MHQGCGLTNAMTGITEAAKSRTPLLVLAAERRPPPSRSNFRIDQDALVRAVGAVAERVHRPDTAVADVVRAWRTAAASGRTVVLKLPLDVQAAPAEPAVTRGRRRPCSRSAAAGRSRVARPGRAARGRAQRPVFIAGRGARGARAPSCRRSPRPCGALLATSAAAKGLFAGDPWYLGVSGGFATPLAAELIAEADLVVGWGASLNMWTTRHGR